MGDQGTRQMYRVMRPLHAGGPKPLAAGQVVDGSGWPSYRIPRLIEQRFITPVEIIVQRVNERKGNHHGQ
jgi:hypothetical protein